MAVDISFSPGPPCACGATTMHRETAACVDGATGWTDHLGHATTPPMTMIVSGSGETIELRYCPTCQQEIRSAIEVVSDPSCAHEVLSDCPHYS